MKKTLLTLSTALALIIPCTVSAKGYQSVVVNKADATVLAIQGDQGMKLTAADNTLRFMLPDESYIELPLDEVTGWEYSDQAGDAQWTSISGVTVNPDAIVRQTATGVTIFNLPEHSIVTLTAINGITVKNLTASGSCQIEFEGLQNGIYLLSFNNQTIKIALNR